MAFMFSKETVRIFTILRRNERRRYSVFRGLKSFSISNLLSRARSRSPPFTLPPSTALLPPWCSFHSIYANFAHHCGRAAKTGRIFSFQLSLEAFIYNFLFAFIMFRLVFCFSCAFLLLFSSSFHAAAMFIAKEKKVFIRHQKNCNLFSPYFAFNIAIYPDTLRLFLLFLLLVGGISK